MQVEDKNFDDLIIDYLSGTISEADQTCFSHLLKTDENFRMRFDEMQKLRAVSYLPDIESDKWNNYAGLIGKIRKSQSVDNSRYRMMNFLKIAAIFVLIVTTSAVFFYIYKNNSTHGYMSGVFETITPIGSQTKIVLPDSSVVWLNSGSSLKYSQSFFRKDRTVQVEGECYFEVAKNKKKPFVVHTGALDIKVLGTKFNVSCYSNDSYVKVSLIEGSINIGLPKSKGSGTEYTVKPNEEITYNKETGQIIKSNIEAYKSALWTTGKLSFVDETIEEISKQLERKYNVKIIILNDRIKEEHFSGSLNLNLSIDEIFSYLDMDKKFIINRSGNKITVGLK